MVFNGSNCGIFSSVYCIWLGGEDSKCMVLVVDPELKVVYKQEYKQAAIDTEIKPLLAELSGGQK